MKTPTNKEFKTYYNLHCKHLALKGLQPKTIDAYSRAIRRIGEHFNGQLDNLTEEQLLVSLMCGSGLRVMENVRLRVKDFDFHYKTIIVRNGKGFKDRVVTFPDPLIHPIKNHFKIAYEQYHQK